MQRSLILCTLAAVLAVVLAPTVAQAASAKGYNTFEIPTTVDEAAKWYEANRAGVLKASNCRIVKDLGESQYQVQVNTPIGANQFVIKESRKDTTNDKDQKVTTYFQTYVRNVSGRTSACKVVIQFTETGEKTKFQMWMDITVSGRFVPQFAVQNVLNGCLSGCEAYVRENAF
ncbi:MAG: hypothetical protein RIC55_32235 [Pirellulaceae bacterium]